MAHKKQPITIKAPKLKAEREKIQSNINAGKEQVGELNKEIKELQKTVDAKQALLDSVEKDLRALILAKGKKEDDLRELGDQISKEKQGLAEVQEELSGVAGNLEAKLKKAEAELQKKIGEGQAKLVGLNRQKSLLEEIIRKEEKKRDGFVQEEGNLSVLIDDKKEKVALIEGAIAEGEKTLSGIESRIGELSSVKEELEAAKEEEIAVKQNVLSVRAEIKEARRQLTDLNETKKRALAGVEKREKDVSKREEANKKKGVDLKALEKRIKVMGNTLQKHFDTHDMKHIRVFEEK